MSNRAFIFASVVFILLAAGSYAHGVADWASHLHRSTLREAEFSIAEEGLHSQTEVSQQAERRHRVSGFAGHYVHELTGLPSLADILLALEVDLALIDPTRGTYAAPHDGDDVRTLRLAEVTDEAPVWLTRSALDRIAARLAARISERVGAPVFAAVDPRDIDPRTGRDLRPGAAAGRPIRFRVEYTGGSRAINGFEPHYLQGFDPDPRPSIDRMLSEVRVDLVRTEAGYVAWRPLGTPGTEPVTLSLDEIARRPAEPYTLAAIQQVANAVKDYLTADAPGRGFMGVIVRPDPNQDPVPLLIITGEVAQLRTLASGDRLSVEGPERINHEAHRRIRERSPVQPRVDGLPGDLLNKRDLDEYVYFLQRHPGRRVDVALAPGIEENTVNVDYLITENRPWLLYGQVSNTGTRQTGKWRARFGLMHTQLTGNDDVLALDYNTAEFSGTHTVTGSYEGRVFDADRLRWRVHGLWSEFEASDVGIPFMQFNGESWMVGAELIWNAYQDRQLFVDVVGGARFLHAAVENIFAPPGIVFVISEASKDFIIPYAGLRLQRTEDTSSITGSLMFEGSLGEFTGIERDSLMGLGRPAPDKDWFVMQWDLGGSFFLEPLLNPEGWRDPTTPETSTLAHEVMLGLRGQHAFGNRLIPQSTMVAGGMFTVRGYPESIVAGDTVLLGSAEYRFHLPRLFLPDPTPGDVFGQPFRWSPQHVYGRPDWNLILRGFVDAARTMNSDRLPFEVDHTLIGAGVGLEFSFRRNLNVRVDWGFALRGLEDSIGRPLVRSGSNRVHFAATLLY